MNPKMLLAAAIVVLVMGLVLVAFVVVSNSLSRNLALGGGAILGAVVLFLTQVYFEMQGAESRTVIAAEYTIDRAQLSIRSWNYPLSGAGFRLADEINASASVAKSDASAFSADREKLTHDMVLYSLLSYLGHEQFDWQLDKVALAGPTMGQITQWQRHSIPSECTTLHAADIRSRLLSAGNAFAGASVSIAGDSLCLPPKTTLRVSKDQVLLSNTYCDLSFRVLSSNSVSNMVPGTGGQVETLPRGESRYETRVTGLEITITYHGLRAQNRLIPKYRTWAERTISGAEAWFAGEPRVADRTLTLPRWLNDVAL